MNERMEQLKAELEQLEAERKRRQADLDVQSKADQVYTLKEIEEIEEQMDDVLMLIQAATGWKAANRYFGRRY